MKQQVFNPYLPAVEYIPDGEPHVFGDRLYIFGSHDRFGGKQYCENDYVVWSAPVTDLSDWCCEGVSYRRDQEPDCKGVLPQLWAPDVCQGPDGKYYLYYSAAFASWIGVARADKPAGPYEYYGKVHYPDGTLYGKKKDDLPFDPGVLADDDGRVWLYTGFAKPERGFQLMLRLTQGLKVTGNCSFVMELDADMLTVRSHKPCLPGPRTSAGTGFDGHAFYEASSMRKFGGRYYYIYSSELSHELAWAVSDRPDSGFTYGGALHSNGNLGISKEAEYPWGNNHGSVEFVNGSYYVFGHRQTNDNECSRQGVAERIEMDASGRFHQAEMTSCGLNGGPLAASGSYPASIACVLHPASGTRKITDLKPSKSHPMITQDSPDDTPRAKQFITRIQDGTVIGYRYFDFTAPCTLQLTSRGNGNGRFSIWQADPGLGGKPVGQISVTVSQDWSQSIGVLDVKAGISPLYLRYEGTGSMELLELHFTAEEN